MENDPLDPAEPLSGALASTRTALAQVKAGQFVAGRLAAFSGCAV